MARAAERLRGRAIKHQTLREKAVGTSGEV
jgi:hypothetical protein